MWKHLLGFFVAIVLIIFASFLIFSNKGLFGGKTTSLGQQVNKFANYSNTNAVASLTIDGPIVANQNFNQVIIKVSSLYTKIYIIDGFNNSTVQKQVFSNNSNSFNAFLKSLALNNFEVKSNNSNGLSGPIGVCPGGDSYIFKLINGSQTIVNTWQTNCLNQPYTFGGNLSEVLNLFENQIPNYNQDVNNLNL